MNPHYTKGNSDGGLTPITSKWMHSIFKDQEILTELEQSIALGGNGKNLVLTAAIKTREQYELAIKGQVPIILDNWDECKQAQTIAEELNKNAIVGIRTSGFIVEGTKLYSRFGFDIDLVEAFILDNFGEGSIFKNLSIQGLHFHLDGYSTLERGKALSDCIHLARRVNARGFQIDFIDMGRRILMNYLESKAQWKDFDKALQSGVKSKHNTLTFIGHGLGYESIDNSLSGKLKTYPFFNTKNGAEFLKEVLDYEDLETEKTNA